MKKKRDYLMNFILQNFFILSLNLNGASFAKKFISQLKDEIIIKFFISQIEKNYFKMCKDQCKLCYSICNLNFWLFKV